MRVGVAGAGGRLGSAAVAAIDGADGLTLSATFVRGNDLGVFLKSGLDVVVDCTVYPVTRDVAFGAVAAGVSPVVGATGWREDDINALRAVCNEKGVPAMLVPNFALGAVLMMRFAAQAARVFPKAEIIELHHDKKLDAPSGTAKLTAQRIHDAGAATPPIHSVRLPGLLAHQEVLFGGVGEVLTLRHDSLSRESFGAGIVAAVRAVRHLQGLTIGLDALVDTMLQ